MRPFSTASTLFFRAVVASICAACFARLRDHACSFAKFSGVHPSLKPSDMMSKPVVAILYPIATIEATPNTASTAPVTLLAVVNALATFPALPMIFAPLATSPITPQTASPAPIISPRAIEIPASITSAAIAIAAPAGGGISHAATLTMPSTA